MKIISNFHYSEIKNFVPEAAFPVVLNWLDQSKFHLKITGSRISKLGDFRPAHRGKPHRITVNHNLNRFSFLITLAHEVGHLNVWNKYGTRVLPHGNEWKDEFRNLLLPLFTQNIFPDDILSCLKNHSMNPKASNCTDQHLVKVLKKYDEYSSLKHLEDLPAKCIFRLRNGKEFIKGEKLRKRFRCTEVSSKKEYLVSPVAEVTMCTLF